MALVITQLVFRTSQTVSKLYCRDGRLDLKELMRVLYKVDLDVDLASARDAAVDAFILFYVDGARCVGAVGSL